MTMQLNGQTKGLPAGTTAMTLDQVGRAGWNVLAEDLPLPLALLKDSSLRHNAAWMKSFRQLTGVTLAPHGKTSMSPELFARQLADGAWGITVATVQQLRVCREHGINRVLMANQLVGRQAIGYVLDELARDRHFQFYCLVDSVAGVELLARAALVRNAGRPLDVLVECGAAGGRTGCRSQEDALAVARKVADARPYLRLAGIEGYEGSVRGASPDEIEAHIATFVEFIGDVARQCAAHGLIDADPVLLSAGGSAYFDMVTRLPRELGGRKTRIVIRSGCYLTHDSDAYAKAAARMQVRMPELAALGDGLRDALELWSYVQSLPEPGLAILTMGKRDVSYDLHLPYPRAAFSPGRDTRPRALPEGCEITALNDQHAYLKLPAEHGLVAGDMIGCAISHPCTTFDKWRFLAIVDDDYNVIDAVTTFF
ncbi:MAG: amino acid deaminase [Betaproteobacteria bacterium]